MIFQSAESQPTRRTFFLGAVGMIEGLEICENNYGYIIFVRVPTRIPH